MKNNAKFVYFWPFLLAHNLHFAGRGTRKYNFWEAGGHDRVFVYTVWASLDYLALTRVNLKVGSSALFYSFLLILCVDWTHVHVFQRLNLLMSYGKK